MDYFEAWLKVNTLLQGYADAIDRADIESLMRIFSIDAILHYTPGKVRRGHSEIGHLFSERFQNFEKTSHHVGPPVITRDEKTDLWQSTAYVSALHLLKNEVRYNVHGRYEDVIRLSPIPVIVERSIIAHLTEGTDREFNFLTRNTLGQETQS